MRFEPSYYTYLKKWEFFYKKFFDWKSVFILNPTIIQAQEENRNNFSEQIGSVRLKSVSRRSGAGTVSIVSLILSHTCAKRANSEMHTSRWAAGSGVEEYQAMQPLFIGRTYRDTTQPLCENRLSWPLFKGYRNIERGNK